MNIFYTIMKNMKNIYCPNCNSTSWIERYSTCTAVYYPIIMKDGVNVNPDGNVTTTYCECINCHYEFSYKIQYGKVQEIILGKKVTPIPTINIPINI